MKIKTITDNNTNEKYICLNDLLINLNELEESCNEERNKFFIKAMIDVMKNFEGIKPSV